MPFIFSAHHHSSSFTTLPLHPDRAIILFQAIGVAAQNKLNQIVYNHEPQMSVKTGNLLIDCSAVI
jgi:hypothetical protein